MSSSRHKSTVRILYKTLLRLHRGLPDDLKFLGNAYVRDEFRKHKGCDAETAAVFVTQWAEYATVLSKQLGIKGLKKGTKVGIDINEDILESMRAEQVVQLYELMKAATEKDEIKTS